MKANAPSRVYPRTSTHTPRLASSPGLFVEVAVLQLQQQQSNSAPRTDPPATPLALLLLLLLSLLPGQHLGAL